ncbi:uncharacterized protein LOC132181814 [Corylus avellana]|uniref:uncharacterized protein LOC132181814 n=1 Tax=Corylus avellana TaxID=13451 RepID=UPI002869EE19|nr:uncharacterized protein LOC132181814 [Corylus avellana]
MKEDETFGEFYTKLSEIGNFMRGLGEGVPEVRVVEKILQSLPPHFEPKIIAVEESKDVELLDVDELVGSLTTYESMRFSSKAKCIALKTSKKEKKVVHEESSVDKSSDSKPIAMLTKNFHKYLKLAKQARRRSSELPSKGESQKDSRVKCYSCKKTHFPQRYECQVSGHIRADSRNLKNARGNAMTASSSDESESNDSDDQKGKKVVYMAIPATIQGFSDRASFLMNRMDGIKGSKDAQKEDSINESPSSKLNTIRSMQILFGDKHEIGYDQNASTSGNAIASKI